MIKDGRIHFQVSILLTLLGIVLALMTAIFSSVYYISTSAAGKTANSLFDEITRRVHERVQRQIGDALNLTSLAASRGCIESVSGDGLSSPALPLLQTALSNTPWLYSVYYGYADGSYLQIVKVAEDPRIISSLSAPEGTVRAVRAITVAKNGSRRQIWSFLNGAGKLIGRSIDERPSYDPRTRPWYNAAQTTPDISRLSQPYVFSSLKEPGLTASRRLADGKGVFGADIALKSLQQFIDGMTVSDGGGVVLSDQNGHVLAAPSRLLPADYNWANLGEMADIPVPQVQTLNKALRTRDSNSDMSATLTSTQGDLMVRSVHWSPPSVQDSGIDIAAIAPVSDFTDHIRHMRLQMLIITVVILGISIPAILLLSRRMAQTVRALADDAKRIERFDFSHQVPEKSYILEFHQLSQAFLLMKKTLSARTEALEESQAKLARLVELGIAVSAEQDGPAMLSTVLDSARDLANAERAVLYRRTIRNELAPAMSRGLNPDQPVPETVPLDSAQISSLVSSALNGISLNEASASRLTVPLKQRGGDVAGVLQLENHRDETGETAPFSEEMQRFVEALAAQAATAMHNHELLADARFRLERLQLQQELDSATRTQMALLPPPSSLSQLGDKMGLSIQAHFQPSSATGGDLWGCHAITDSQLGFYAFDFTGHGMAAALNTFRLHALIHEHRELWAEPTKLLSCLDGTLSRLLPLGQYATIFYGVLDTGTGLLTWAGGGAPEPLFLSSNGTLERLSTRGLPLGISKRTQFERPQHQRIMHPGDLVMFHSDGMNEALLPDGEMFGDDAVAETLRNAAIQDGLCNLDDMMKGFLDRVVTPLADDLTAVLISRR